MSPDGKQLIASVLTLPARNPNAQGPPDPPFVPGSHAYLEIFAAPVGGPATSMGRTDLGTFSYSAPILRVVGWDDIGPLVTLQQSLGTQQGSLGNWFEGMQLAHLDPSGHAGPAFTPADCMPWQALDDSSVLCSRGDFRNVRLIDVEGKTVASFPGVSGPFLTLSPDRAWVAYLGWRAKPERQSRDTARRLLSGGLARRHNDCRISRSQKQRRHGREYGPGAPLKPQPYRRSRIHGRSRRDSLNATSNLGRAADRLPSAPSGVFRPGDGSGSAPA